MIDNLHTTSLHLLQVSADFETSIQVSKSVSYAARTEGLPNLNNYHIFIEEFDEPAEPFLSPRQLSGKVMILYTTSGSGQPAVVITQNE